VARIAETAAEKVIARLALPPVIPAQAGIDCGVSSAAWIPACAHCCPGKRRLNLNKLLRLLA